MLIPAGWLQEYLGKKVSPQKMAEAMELAGIEVEGVERTPGYDTKIAVAEVAEVKKHPNADKLYVVAVEAGGKKVQLVSGAPGLKKGQKVTYASVGAALPDGRVMQEVSIRGVASPGMLLSAKELQLGEDHSTIMELDSELKAGTPLNKVFAEEVVIDARSAANRPDLQAVAGVAREVAAQLGTRAKVGEDVPEFEGNKPQHFDNRVKELVPRYALAKLELPKQLPSTPGFIKQRLQLSGIRPINVVVDATNYVMLEFGQPLHAFDAAKVSSKVIIRTAKQGEKTQTLDEETRTLSNKDLVIADSRKIIGIAGVMGSLNSEITDKTKSVLLEAANFDGATTRRTATRQGLRTEASARFERNLPLQLVPVGMARALELLEEHVKAKVVWVEDELNTWPWVQHIGVKPKRLSDLAGTKLTEKQVVDSLGALGFDAEPFDIVREARKHLGKPYFQGAKFKTHGISTFDCGYLVDYIYSLIGKMVGHHTLQIWESGESVKLSDLKPGDTVYRDGPWVELSRRERKGFSNVALYICDGKIIHTRDYFRNKDGEWEQLPKDEQMVVEEPVEAVTKDPDFKGARRHVKDLAGYVAVTVPWWRTDVKTEEDVFEEIIKLVGLDKLPSTLPNWQPIDFTADKSRPPVWKLREILTGLGLMEVVTYPFVSAEQLEMLGLDPSKHLKIRNPRSVEQSHLRTDLLPSMLSALANNSRQATEFGFYDIGRVFSPQSAKPLPREENRLAVIYQSPKGGYQAVKNALDNLAQTLGVTIEFLINNKQGHLHPGRQSELILNGKSIGLIGEINPQLTEELKIRGRVGYLEIEVEPLIAAASTKTYRSISRYQTISRDLTLEVDSKIHWQDMGRVLSEAGFEDVEYIGDYYGPKVGAGRRALTLRVNITPTRPSISEQEIADAVGKVADILSGNFGAEPQS